MKLNPFRKKRTYRKKAKEYRSEKDRIAAELRSALTNNVHANLVFSPVYFALTYWILTHWHFSLESNLIYSSISTFMYAYVSHFYQPDLDIHERRPGMGHFPLGKTIGYFKWGRFFKFIFFPVNRAWYWLWHPYGNLLTHRGIGHYPVLGVWIRTLYLWGIYLVAKYIFLTYNFYPLLIAHLLLVLVSHKKEESPKDVIKHYIFNGAPKWFRNILVKIGLVDMVFNLKVSLNQYWKLLKALVQGVLFWGTLIALAFLIEKLGLSREFAALFNGFEVWLRNFFPWLKKTDFLVFFLFCFPIYLSDLVHWAVDYRDSYKNGNSFCPPRIPRGLIVQFFNLLTGRNL